MSGDTWIKRILGRNNQEDYDDIKWRSDDDEALFISDDEELEIQDSCENTLQDIAEEEEKDIMIQ